ncbi:tyrosinase family protein [Mesorhizobium sp. M0220]|uniref:tyrosinase family protein n=1 Tax=Mesorhizobium sp. M0220 TaxID=2956920 RepID=UPI003337089D
MAVSLRPYGSDSPDSGYIAWTPVPLVVASPLGGTLRISSRSAAGSAARVVFLQDRNQSPQSEIEVDLQAGEQRTIFIAGEFQPGERHSGASVDGKDVTLEARWLHEPETVVAAVEIMIRVRRNANELSDQARNDFLFALAKLNGILVDTDPTPGPGRGIYVTDFVKMHVQGATGSEHGDSHFLPWHRLYLLDLERLLQAIKPTVTLPYWRFDQAAPHLFTEDFMGAIDQIPRDSRQPGGAIDSGVITPPARFALDNPLSRWQIGDVQGIPRTARFDPQSGDATGLILPDGRDFRLASQDVTLGLGGGVPPDGPKDAKLGSPTLPKSFARMEGTPHGAAHMSFNGRINNVPVAPEDPLFFLLHCNIDRLWALWQGMFERDEQNDTRTYPYQQAGDAAPWEIINARQWPWDGGTSQPGSLLPPGTRKENFAQSNLVVNFPNNSPRIESAIDPYANHNSGHYLGFGYDDVQYNHVEPPIS